MVGTTDLKLTLMSFTQMVEIVGLQELVAKLRVADPTIPIHAGLDGILGEHGVHGKMLSDVAQEIEEAQWGGPISIINELGRIFCAFEVEESRELLFDAADVVGQLFACEQVALCGLA